MKVSLIMGRGIEGCGVTKFALEQLDWFKENGHQVTLYASRDKSWSRKKSHMVDDIQHLKFGHNKKQDELSIIIKGCQESDLVIINSLPASSVDDTVKEGFDKFLNEVKTKMVLVQHDHSSLSIKRNACLDEAIKRADMIFSHSSTNDFSKYAKTVLGVGGLSSFFGEEEPETKIFNFQPGMNFDNIKEQYWKDDISDQDPLHHKWIGRTTSWKGYKQMFEFHNNFLMPNDRLTTFEGIERSPAYLDFKKITEYNDQVATNFDISGYDLSEDYGKPAVVFGPFVNTEMLERMSKVGFGYQLSILKPEFIERSIEYTHCEVVCTGTIPVFRKRYGQQCTHRSTGKKLIDHADTGTVWFDDDNMQSTMDLIEELTNNHDLRNTYRKDAFEFYREHQDASYTFAEMLEKITTEL